MRIRKSTALFGIFMGLLLWGVGCSKQTESTPSTIKPTRGDDMAVSESLPPATAEQISAANLIAGERAVRRSRSTTQLPDGIALADVHPPRVLLSVQHESTCLRKIGDSLLDLQFSDLTTSSSISLASVLGERLTVVVFCDLDFDMSAEQVARLEKELIVPDGKAGVSVVAIHVGAAETAIEFRKQLSSATRLLVDTGDAYQKIASMKPPRTFLLDANGRIVWFDIEYSRGMRIELDNAIRFHLKQLFNTARTAAIRKRQ